ncbi:Rossmann-fold NAD(P)-binding domain-containing protein [Aquirufa aurantiipilula]
MFDISILGGGWVGVPLAEKLASLGYSVKISQSSQTNSIQNPNISLIDWRAEVNLPQLAWESILDAKTIIWTIPPRRKVNGDHFYLEVLADFVRILNKKTHQQVIFLSSTSVYKAENAVVNEASALENNLMCQAEEILHGLQSPLLLLRLGGLMGGERFVSKYYAGKNVPAANHPVNYVHRLDVLEIINQSIKSQLRGVYNVVAPLHPIKSELVKSECQLRGLELPVDYLEDKEAIKVVSSDKLIQALNYTFQYPDPLTFPIEN